MKQWFNANELKGLTGLAKSERNIVIIADRENFDNRPKAKGKGLEYHIDSIEKYAPQAAAELRKKHSITILNEQTQQEEVEQTIANAVKFAINEKKATEEIAQARQAKKMKNLKEFG
ncbi:MAG: DNA-binding protein, partial [Pseudomonadota bacterium]